MGFELAEQMDWSLPDVIVYPTGGGVGLIGMWKAFDELREIGWIARDDVPRFVAAQSTGCAPIVRAFEEGADESQPWPDPRTFAAGIRVPKALGDFLVLRALRETGGTAVAVNDEQIADVMRLVGMSEGMLVCPEGAAALAAAANLRRDPRRDRRSVPAAGGERAERERVPLRHARARVPRGVVSRNASVRLSRAGRGAHRVRSGPRRTDVAPARGRDRGADLPGLARARTSRRLHRASRSARDVDPGGGARGRRSRGPLPPCADRPERSAAVLRTHRAHRGGRVSARGAARALAPNITPAWASRRTSSRSSAIRPSSVSPVSAAGCDRRSSASWSI